MAEFPDLGQHCSVTGCTKLDFLPFKCDFCLETYCVDHKATIKHQCTRSGENGKENENCSYSEAYGCQVADCSNKEVVRIECGFCGLQVCLQHRFHSNHNCSKYQSNIVEESLTSQHVKNILDSKPSKEMKGQGRKSHKTSSMVKLMKLKQSSVGESSVPVAERIYLCMALPITFTKFRTRNIFFSKLWTVGKCVDYAASKFSVSNFNNQTTKKKLCLFTPDTGICLTSCQTLEIVVSNGNIYNGANVIMEYVQCDSEVLKCPENYFTER